MPDGQNQGPPSAPKAAPAAALGRERMLATMDEAIAARARGDKEAMRGFLAPGATFRIAGESDRDALLPAGPALAREVLDGLVDLVRFHEVERLDTIVEGNRAAVRWRIDVSIGGGPVTTTEVFDLWTFDGEGRVTDLLQFIDTALLASLMAQAKG